MANYNILMNRFNGTTHDTLLPKNSLEGTSNPTSSTVGIAGQFYLNVTTKKLFQCVSVSGNTYTWEQIYGADEVFNNTTKALYNFPTTATPNDAFSKIGTQIARDIRTYPIEAGYTISAKDVVDVVNGKVKKTIVDTGISITTVESANVTKLGSILLNETTGVEVYRNGADFGGYVRLVKIANGNIRYVSQGVLVTSDIGNYQLNLCRVTDTTFVLFYYASGFMIARLGVVNGDAISLPSEGGVTLGSSGNYSYAAGVAISNTELFYTMTGDATRVGTILISGTTLSQNNNYYTDAGNGVTVARLPDESGNRKVISFVGGANGGPVKVFVSTVNASRVITNGSQVSIGINTLDMTCCADGNDAIFTYFSSEVSNYYTAVRVVSVSGLTPTVSPTPLVLASSTSATTHNSSVTKSGSALVVAYNSGGVKAAKITRSGTTLTLGTPYPIDSIASSLFNKVDSYNSVLLIGYTDTTNISINPVKATTISLVNGVLQGVLKDFSREAIALDSGASGQSIRLAYQGSVELTGVNEGTIISSNGLGVSAYSPQNNWLSVAPYWRKRVGNKNLLDNAWFASPYLVNQRGQSSYTDGYCVDRWIAGGTFDVALRKFTATSAYGRIHQLVDNASTLSGKTVTLSADVTNGVGVGGVILTQTTSSGQSDFIVGIPANFSGVVSVTATLNASISALSAGVLVDAPFNSIVVNKVKLELGSVSTLHLDTPPSPAEQELNRQVCKRYYQRIGVGMLGRWGNSNAFSIYSVLPVEMRITPTVSLAETSATLFRVGLDRFVVAGLSILSVESASPKGVGVAMHKMSGGSLTVGEFVAITSDIIALSADL